MYEHLAFRFRSNTRTVFIFAVVSIARAPLSTVQVDRRVKKELFAIAADLQSKLGKKTSLNDAIDHLIKSYRGRDQNIKSVLSLFGTLGKGNATEARRMLAELRKQEEERIERIARKYGA